MKPDRMPSPKRSKPRAKIASKPAGRAPAGSEGPEPAGSEQELLYLDASALVKLVWPEPETPALVAALGREARFVSSEIAEIELLRALRRKAGDAAAKLADATLQSVRLLPLGPSIRCAAGELRPTTLRALDAIHLATAMQLDELLGGFYAYDARLIDAARSVGLHVLAPSEDNPGGAEPPADRSRPADVAENPHTDTRR